MDPFESSAPIPGALSENFADETAEIMFVSSDDILFRIHRDYLEISSEGFSPPATANFSEKVNLSEDAATLELLFGFIYPNRIPSLASLDFRQLARLAEAAEKYQVYPAMDLCFLYMKEAIRNRALEVFAYATRHDYRALASTTAPAVVHEKLETVIAAIPNNYVVAWVKYYERWAQVVQNALTVHAASIDRSRIHYEVFADVTARLTGSLGSLQKLDEVFPMNASPEIKTWRRLVETDILAIPTFTYFVTGKEEDRHPMTLAGGAADADLGSPRIEEQAIDKHFQDPEATIIYTSCNGAIFRIHERNIQLSGCSLPYSKADKQRIPTDPIPLEEDSGTLDALFRHIYPLKRPDITTWDIEWIADLAYAAEKYKVYSAIAVCNYQMRQLLSLHPDAVFKYAAAHDYPDLMDKAAPEIVDMQLQEVVEELSEDAIRAWIRYYEVWCDIARKALRTPSKWAQGSGCHMCFYEPSQSTLELVYRLGEGPACLTDLESLFDSSSCCLLQESRWETWKTSLKEQIAAIPQFTTFLADSVSEDMLTD